MLNYSALRTVFWSPHHTVVLALAEGRFIDIDHPSFANLVER